jgi:hypothetical protein
MGTASKDATKILQRMLECEDEVEMKRLLMELMKFYGFEFTGMYEDLTNETFTYSEANGAYQANRRENPFVEDEEDEEDEGFEDEKHDADSSEPDFEGADHHLQEMVTCTELEHIKLCVLAYMDKCEYFFTNMYWHLTGEDFISADDYEAMCAYQLENPRPIY